VRLCGSAAGTLSQNENFWHQVDRIDKILGFSFLPFLKKEIKTQSALGGESPVWTLPLFDQQRSETSLFEMFIRGKGFC
jgi:hypothetical protein